MKPTPHELYDTVSEQVDAVQAMTVIEADRRNQELRRAGDTRRWVEAETEAP